jgi:hypothetical protein
MSELLLYQKSYDFLVWIFNKTDGFPKLNPPPAFGLLTKYYVITRSASDEVISVYNRLIVNILIK